MADVAAADLTCKPKFFGKFFDKPRIGIGGLATQPVIEVADDQILKTRFGQKMKQCHRICAAGNTDQITRTPRRMSKPENPWRNIHTAEKFAGT
jgi:hypothetical protein